MLATAAPRFCTSRAAPWAQAEPLRGNRTEASTDAGMQPSHEAVE
jgi:hypothetical protein